MAISPACSTRAGERPASGWAGANCGRTNEPGGAPAAAAGSAGNSEGLLPGFASVRPSRDVGHSGPPTFFRCGLFQLAGSGAVAQRDGAFRLIPSPASSLSIPLLGSRSPARSGPSGSTGSHWGDTSMKLDTYSNEAALVGRIFFSSLFVLYGYFKITAFAGTTAYMTRQGLPAPALFAALAVIFELGGGLLM